MPVLSGPDESCLLNLPDLHMQDFFNSERKGLVRRMCVGFNHTSKTFLIKLSGINGYCNFFMMDELIIDINNSWMKANFQDTSSF